MISSFTPLRPETLNLRFLPTDDIPIEEIVRRSPTEYPVPPFATVAATATPLDIVTLAVPFLPVPVIFDRFKLLYVTAPALGVYPIPELVIVSPDIVPAVPTRIPVAFDCN